MKTIKTKAISILSFVQPMEVEIILDENNVAYYLNINGKEKHDLKVMNVVKSGNGENKELFIIHKYDFKQKTPYFLTLRFYKEDNNLKLAGGLYPENHIGGCSLKPVII